MHRIDAPSATVEEQFTEGSPAGGVPATIVTAAWLNDIQEELVSILSAAGILPSKGVQDQLLTALFALLPAFSDQEAVFASNGWMTVPVMVAGVKRKLILNWGVLTDPVDAQSATFALAFPNVRLGGPYLGNDTQQTGLFYTAYGATLTGFNLKAHATPTLSRFVKYLAIGW